MKSIAGAILCLGLMLCSGAAAAEKNSVFGELTGQGVALTNGQVVKLPAPLMADGLSAEEQEKVIKDIAPQGQAEAFMSGRVSSPFALKMKDFPGKEGQSIGRQYDLYFVAVGKLDKVTSKNFVQRQLDQGSDRGKVEYYSDDELKERDLKPLDTDEVKQRYAHARFELFGSVEVSGTGNAMQTTTPDSVLVAFKLDPAFANDKQFPNQWRSIAREGGGKKFGPPEPYSGAGAYVKVTRLAGTPERVFVEYHIVFDEPHGWFGGDSTLASKLPSQYEKDVRKFRRELAK